MRACNISIFSVLLVVASQNLAADTWIENLPARVRGQILWGADHESGSMDEWTFAQFQHPGGGIFNTGGDDVTAALADTVAHSGNWSARTTISNAVRAQNGNRAVRLMRWTDRPWDDGGDYFPEAAYYSTWAYFPEVYNPNKYAPWDPGDGGWWNIFQFKGRDENGESQPIWTLNVDHDDTLDTTSLYLYTKFNEQASYGQAAPVTLPAGQWVHLESLYRSATGENGQIKIWQDGQLILQADNVVTSLGGTSGEDTHVIWGIGNYTDHIDGDPANVGTATIYFDDSLVSTVRVSNGGDFDGNGAYECADVDALVTAIASGANDEFFDLTGDDLVNKDDLSAWLADAGAEILSSGHAFQPADANLDGTVDTSDFNAWNENRFAGAPAFCSGDFTADGRVDTSDFNLWNEYKFTSAGRDPSAAHDPSAVPESVALHWLLPVLAASSGRRRRRR